MEIFARTGTTRKDLGGGNWVELKNQLTLADKGAITGAMTKVNVDGNGGAEAVFDIGAANVVTLQRAIVAWGGPALDDKPVDRETLEALSDEAGQYLVDAVNEMNPSPKKEATANP